MKQMRNLADDNLFGGLRVKPLGKGVSFGSKLFDTQKRVCKNTR